MLYNARYKKGDEEMAPRPKVTREMIMDAADFVEVPYEMEELATEEALDRAASVADDSGIPEVTEEEAKESAREAAQGNK